MCTEIHTPLAHRGLLVMICKRFHWALGENIEFVDLLAEANIACLRAARGYDPSAGPWAPYVDVCVHRHLMQYALAQRSTVHVPVRVQKQARRQLLTRVELQDSTDDSGPDAAVEHQRRAFALELLQVLTEREQAVVAAVFVEDKSTRLIATELGISRQLVSSICKRSIVKMRAEASRRGLEMP